MRDFVIKIKDELKVAYNFHCAGKQFIIPYNSMMPNTLAEEHPDVMNMFNEIIAESKFAQGTDIGPSTQTLGFLAGGDAGDWMAHALGIPAAEYEIGSWEDYDEQWVPLSS